MSETMEILTPHGHLLLTWDPSLPESVERARQDFDGLVAAGYQFFRVETDTPEPGFSPNAGALVVKRVDAAEVAPQAEPQTESAQPRRRGRPARVVATRPMRGG